MPSILCRVAGRRSVAVKLALMPSRRFAAYSTARSVRSAHRSRIAPSDMMRAWQQVVTNY